MEPTLDVGQRVLVNRFLYHFKDPQIGDIVVFHPPQGANSGGAGGECGDPRTGAGGSSGAACDEPTPQEASVNFIKDFGDTSALLLSVASPRASEVEVALRAQQLARAIRQARAETPVEGDGERVTLVASFPFTLDPSELRVVGAELSAWAESRGARNVRLLSGDGFLGIDSQTVASDQKILEHALDFARERLRGGELHPDIWRLAVIRDQGTPTARGGPGEARALLGDALAWQVTLYFGLQSLIFYVALTWLPSILRDEGYGAGGVAIFLELPVPNPPALIGEDGAHLVGLDHNLACAGLPYECGNGWGRFWRGRRA